MFVGLFALGTFSFWLLTVCAVAFLFYCVEELASVKAFFTILITLALMTFLGGLPLWGWIANHPLLSLLYLAGYVVVGVVWSGFKWDRFSAELGRRYKEAREEFMKKLPDKLVGLLSDDRYFRFKGQKERSEAEARMREEIGRGTIPSELRDEFGRYLAGSSGYDACGSVTLSSKPPQASDHKSRIIAWTMYWPCSILWYFIREFVLEFFENLFNWLKGTYQAVANRHFKDITPEPESKRRAEQPWQIEE